MATATTTTESKSGERDKGKVPGNGQLPERNKDGGLTFHSEDGQTVISTTVIADIAGLAIREVQGVHGLVPFGAGQALSAFASRLGASEAKDIGVHVEVGQIEAAVDCRIVTVYGEPIQNVASQIRKNLRERIKAMTGLTVKEVNIEVVDLYFPEEERDEPVGQLPAPKVEPRVR